MSQPEVQHALAQLDELTAAGDTKRAAALLSQPSLKLWAWAVPDVDAAVFLHTDLLLLRPLDSLLSRAIELTTKQGVSGCSCKSRYGDRFFNTGVFLYRPSLETLESLLRLHRFAQVLSIPQPRTPSLRPPCALPAPSLRPPCALSAPFSAT